MCCNYYRLFCKDDSTHAICEARSDRGLLCCDKQARSKYGQCCSYAHASCKRTLARAVAQFVAHDYGADYIDLHTSDKLLFVDANIEMQGWAYGRNLSTDKVGWFPPAFVEAMQ